MSTSSEPTATAPGDTADRFVGLSIGDREVQLVLLDRSRRVLDACAVDTPPASVIDGTIVDPARLTRLLRTVGEELGLAGASAVVALRPSGSSLDTDTDTTILPGGRAVTRPVDGGPVEPAQQAVARRIAAAAGLSVLRVEHALLASVRGLAPGAAATGLVLLPSPAPGLALVTAGGELVTGTVWRATGPDPQFWPMERSMTDLLLRGGLEQRIALLTRIVRRQQPDPIPLRRGGDGLAPDSQAPLPSFAAALGAAIAASDGLAPTPDLPTTPERPLPRRADRPARTGAAPAPVAADAPPLAPAASSDEALPGPTEASVTTDPASSVAVPGPVHPLFVRRGDEPGAPPEQPVTGPAWSPVDPERGVQRRRAAAGGIVAVALAAGLLAVAKARDDTAPIRVDAVDTTGVSEVPAPGSTSGVPVASGPTATVLSAPAGPATPVTLPGDVGSPTTSPATAPPSAATPAPTTSVPAASGGSAAAPTVAPPPTSAPAPSAPARSFPARVIDGIPVNSPQVLTLTDRTEADLADAAVALGEILAARPAWSARLLADGSDGTAEAAADIAARVAIEGIDPGRVVVEPTGAVTGTLTVVVVAPDA